MAMITPHELHELLEEHRSPCISIYQPLHRSYVERQQDSLEFRHRIDSVEESMKLNDKGAEVHSLIENLRGIANDECFWREGRDGVAILASPTGIHTFDMRRPVPALAIVADSFHVKPLLRSVQSADRFHLLCLQRDKIRLYEGNRDGLAEIKPAGVPLTITDALGDDVVAQRGKAMSIAGKSGESRPAPRGPDMPAGHPAKGDDAKLDAMRFFRTVDDAVLNRVSRPSELPLLVMALPEDWAAFHALSHNPQLLDSAIERSPARISERQLLSEAWKHIEPLYVARLDELVENYRIGGSRGLASNDLSDVRRAAQQGRVSALLIKADDGRLPEATGGSKPTAANPSLGALGDDPLDDLAELFLRQKGTVVVVPPERMPSITGLAAIYRF